LIDQERENTPYLEELAGKDGELEDKHGEAPRVLLDSQVDPGLATAKECPPSSTFPRSDACPGDGGGGRCWAFGISGS